MTQTLTPAIADRLARLILPSLHREYPNKVAHVLHGDADVAPPRVLTPMFHGCFDWHSSVHSHWAIARLLHRFPAAPWAAEARAALARSFTAANLEGELAYLGAEHHHGFELPYGMAWLLHLATEITGEHIAIIQPLEAIAAERLSGWLTALPCPVRTGEHSQSAFAMGLMLDWACARGNQKLAALVAARARDFHAGDRDGPLAYEPSAYDFLSPCLAAADLLARILPAAELAAWLTAFLPDIELEPVTPVSRADGKLVHWDGLNLSRAWMLRRIATALPRRDPRRPHLYTLADQHGRAGLAAITSEHYAGAHWLGSFAVYWLSEIPFYV